MISLVFKCHLFFERSHLGRALPSQKLQVITAARQLDHALHRVNFVRIVIAMLLFLVELIITVLVRVRLCREACLLESDVLGQLPSLILPRVTQHS